jgi:hypothetical protein
LASIRAIICSVSIVWRYNNPVQIPIQPFVTPDVSCSTCDIDGVWIGERICWPLRHTTRNYKQVQHHS